MREISARDRASVLGVPDQNPRCPDWRHMAFHYDCMEFNTALKPWVLRNPAQPKEPTRWSTSTRTLRSSTRCDELERVIRRTLDSVLTPHLLEPLEDDGLTRRGCGLSIGCGAVQPWLRGVSRKTDEVIDRRFEVVVRAACAETASSDFRAGVFVDQSWAALFTVVLPRTAKVLRLAVVQHGLLELPQRSLRRPRREPGYRRWAAGVLSLLWIAPRIKSKRCRADQSRMSDEPKATPLHTRLCANTTTSVQPRARGSLFSAVRLFVWQASSDSVADSARTTPALSGDERESSSKLIANPFAVPNIINSVQESPNVQLWKRLPRKEIAKLPLGKSSPARAGPSDEQRAAHANHLLGKPRD